MMQAKVKTDISPIATIEMISPARAKEMLERNEGNRHIRPTVWRRYSGDMSAGLWYFNNGSIAFDQDNVLLDGQHRLLAIIDSGVTVQMWVMYGMPRVGAAGMDIGATRDAADLAGYRGLELMKDSAAIAKVVMQGLKSMSFGQISKPQILEFYLRHHEAIDFVSKRIQTRYGERVFIAPVKGTVARAFYHRPPERLERFLEVLGSGIMERGDEAAVVLRNWLMSQVTVAGSALRTMIYAKTARAIEAFCKYEPLTKLYRCDVDPFPLPEESDND